MFNISLDAPNLGDLEKEYLLRAVDSNYLSTAGPFVPEFESNFAVYLKSPACVAVQSGTAALHIALYELGIGAGDEVIVPAVTFIASVNPVVQVGGTPVFVDLDPQTWNMDPHEIRNAITTKTKAIIPVHLYGNPCNMDEIGAIAREYGLKVIEDATESLGAFYKGQATGTFGDAGCFSFNGNKVITTGGGGMVAFQDPGHAGHARFLANQARDASRGYYHPEIGFNYRMTNLEAALGLAQMKRLAGFLALKRQYYEIYREVFSGVDGIRLQQVEKDAVSSKWFSSVRIDTRKFASTIPEIQTRLHEKGIPSRRIFPPLVDFPPYLPYKKESYPVAYDVYENGLNLPSSTLNTPDSIQWVAETVLKVLGV